MSNQFTLAAAAAMLVAGWAATGLAQGQGHAYGRTGGGGMSASTVGTGAGTVSPGGANGVVGSGGSAATGGTSASSLGLGADSITPNQSSSALGTGGSAASANGGRVMSHSGVHGGHNAMTGQSMDQAHQQGGVWSKSHTTTHLHQGDLTSRTKSMAHEPGGPPVKSMSGSRSISAADSGRLHAPPQQLRRVHAVYLSRRSRPVLLRGYFAGRWITQSAPAALDEVLPLEPLPTVPIPLGAAPIVGVPVVLGTTIAPVGVWVTPLYPARCRSSPAADAAAHSRPGTKTEIGGRLRQCAQRAQY